MVLRQSRSAIAVLRPNWEDLTRLIDDFSDTDQEALDLIARLEKLAAKVIEALSGRASGRMRAGLPVDRVDIREVNVTEDQRAAGPMHAGLRAAAPRSPRAG